MLLCCVYMCAVWYYLCMCAHVHGIECANIRSYIWKPEESLGVVLSCSPPYFLRKGLFLNLNLIGYMRQASQ